MTYSPTLQENLICHSADSASAVDASGALKDDSPYEFVGQAFAEKYTGLDSASIVNLLAYLSAQPIDPQTPKSYFYNREIVCSMNLALTEIAKIPPRFRPSRKVSWSSKSTLLSSEMQALSNDKKIIDLHWLHSLGKRHKVHDNEYRDLFDKEHFDFDLATSFVQKKWKTEARVTKILGLTDVEQWQLSSLVSSDVRKRWTKVNEGALAVDKVLREAAYRRPQIADDVEHFKFLWIADQICDGRNLNLINLVYGWQTGIFHLSKATLSAKLKRMRHWARTK